MADAPEMHNYWHEFPLTTYRFYKTMIGDYKTCLRLPEKFMNNFRGVFSSDSIDLYGPSGNKWTTQMVRKKKDFALTNGWEIFVRDHQLQSYDLLVFQCAGASSFSVVIFDSTGCERESSYFVKKNKILPKVGVRGYLMPQQQGYASWLNDEEQEEDIVVDEDDKEEMEKCTKQNGEKIERDGSSEDFIYVTDCCSDSGEESLSYEGEGLSDEDPMPLSTINKTHPQGREAGNIDQDLNYPVVYRSNRRMVTDEEIQKAHQRATMYSPGNGRPFFVVTMAPSNVYFLFSLTIPKKWARPNLPPSEEFLLRVPEYRRTWPVSCKKYGVQTSIRRGWRQFVFDNHLEEHDVCVFELHQSIHDTGKRRSVFLVNIFRVVTHVVPVDVIQANSIRKKRKWRP